MIQSVPVKHLQSAIEQEKDVYKSKLLEMNYFKTPDGRQLYELSLREIKCIYQKEKARLNHDS